MPASVFMITFAGQVIDGASVSFTIIEKSQLSVFPAQSDMKYSTLWGTDLQKLTKCHNRINSLSGTPVKRIFVNYII